MDKGKTCKSCCKLKEGIDEMGRCETCQAKVGQNSIEILRCKSERKKQERLDTPEEFREKEKHSLRKSKLGEDKGQPKGNIIKLR